ncbi:MAG: primary-amine oxidase [Chloroflexi bacterium]|nr:primary-amine oxidase [Chloroflexota bacterium]
MVTVSVSPTSTAHPLDPLSAAEIAEAVAIVRAQRTLGPRTRFASVGLREPTRQELRQLRAGATLDREAEVILLDNGTKLTHEAIVSLARGTVVRWRDVPGVQPPVMLDEFYECELAVKADPCWQAAVQKRGVTDFDLCMVDPWSNGHYGAEEDGALRLVRALTWVRANPRDNGYARPIENLIAVVDLNAMQVVRVEDGAVVPLPPQDANYTAEAAGPVRTDLKPIAITQPDGPSFAVNGYEVRWQKWRLRVGFNGREGLVLYDISYQDGDRERSVLERASVVDMVVPYGDPRHHYNRRNAFDVGEYGIGVMANSLSLGCDCLGEISYFDACLNNSRGEPVPIPNAICMHEEDYGILWKHYDIRLNEVEVRRSRRLVVSSIATVGNYEYGFYWYFYQDGSLQLEVKMTGIVTNGALADGEPTPPWGVLVAPNVYAPIHQHFFSARLDVAVDGPTNRVEELHTVADPLGPENPLKNAFREVSRPLLRESEAQRVIDPLSARYWKITNPAAKNGFGRPTAYKLMPGDNVLPFAADDAPVIERARFMTKHLWVTQYEPTERYAAGDYPNQHPGGAGLPEFVAQDRSLDNEELVVWYTFGAHHSVRPEDWPVMPVTCIGFMLRPSGFFDRSPALDVPRPVSAHCATDAGNGGSSECCH